jgi:hypothetical protein
MFILLTLKMYKDEKYMLLARELLSDPAKDVDGSNNEMTFSKG